MADFFKGLAGGFQTGLQFGEARRRNQEYQEQLAERERLRQIYGAEPTMTPGQAATPEQIQSAGLETGRLQMNDTADFGLSSEEAARYAPQMPSAQATTTPTTYSFGGLTRQTPFSADELNRMRMQQAIPVLAVRNPAEAMRMQAALATEERQAARAPLELEALRGQVASGALSRRQSELQIQEAERQAQQRQRADAFTAQLTEARRQNPNMTPSAMFQMASESGLGTAEIYQVMQNITGVDKALFEQGERDIKKMIRGKGLDGIVDQFNKSDLIGPGRNYRVDRDPKSGAVSLTLIDAATGNAVGGAQRFANEGEATGYLSRMATNPETVGEYVANLETRRAQVDYYKSQANRNDAIAKASRSFTPEQATELNNLSADIDAARETGDEAKAKRLTEKFELQYRTYAGQMGRVMQPRPAAQVKPAPDLNPMAMKRYEELIKGDRFKNATPAEQRQILIDNGFDPVQAGYGGGIPDRRVGERPAPGLTRGTQPAPAPAPTPAVGSGLSSIVSQPQAPSRDVIEADLAQRAAERGLARDELRSIYRAEVEQLGLTADAVKGLAPQRARDLRNSPYFEFFPRNVQRALTDRAGM